MSLDFSDDSISIEIVTRKMRFWNHYAATCDSLGDLIAYTNGCFIVNSEGDTLINGNDINPGDLADLFCGPDKFTQSNNIRNSGFFIPIPYQNKKYMLLQLNYYDSRVRDLCYSIIDMNAANGRGAVLEKNIRIVESELAMAVAATKHANGRDWWIVVNKFQSNTYYVVLMHPEGFEVFSQNIGEPFDEGKNAYEILFSPDGEKLAAYQVRDDLRLFDFDRCTGVMSNPEFIPKIDSADALSTSITGGCAFSADSRFVYVSDGRVYAIQYDTWAIDIEASKDTVAFYDGFNPSWPSTFGIMELAPDGRIYCKPTSGSAFELHVINNPERKGDACDFRRHEYHLDYPTGSLPMYPNYRLGPIDGSPCDTLGIDNHPLAGFRYDRSEGLKVDFTSVSWYEPTTWFWTFGDGQTSSEVHPSHVFPKTGYYNVCLKVCNQYSCDSICKWVWVDSALDSPVPQISKRGVSVFPNPTSDYLNIFLDGQAADLTVRIFDAVGKLCFQKNLNSPTFSIEGLHSGFYFVQVFKDERLVGVKKISVVR